MIFELTRDYSVIVPLMIANLVSLFISSQLQKQPIYEALAHQDGIHLPNLKTRRALEKRKVAQVMRSATELLPAGMVVREAMERVRASELRTWLVADEGSVLGVLNWTQLESAAAGGPEKKLAELFASLDFPHVHSDQALHLALERMSGDRLDLLPVVNRADIHRLEGVVTLRDVLDAYGVDWRGGDSGALAAGPDLPPVDPP
jgi:CIC family chloride channel protein